MSSERTRRVGVVGGGVAGLAAARRLIARGDLDVVVWEAADRAGGVISTSTADGFTREHAANGFLTGAPDGAADLAEELGVAVEPASPAAQRRWVYRGGALRPIPSGPADLLRAELVSWRGLLHALGEPFRPPRRSGPEETVAEFARRRLGDEVLEALVAPFCTGVFAGDPERLSLRAAFPRLAALEDEGGLVRGSALRLLRRLLSQEEGGRAAPSRPRLAAPQGGMAQLMAALVREVGPRLELGCPAVAVEVEGGGRARAVRLADGRREPCDAVVLATPAPIAARLVSDASRELARLLDSIPYAAAAVVHLGYRRDELRVAPEALDGFGFLVARGEELRVLGAVFESVIWPSRAPADHVLIRCILGGTRDPAALDLGDAELVEQSHRDLERAVGLGALPVHRHVVRWPRAIAQYTVGHLDRVARAEELAEEIGVVLAGASYHGVAVNSCASDASRVTHRVVSRLGLPVALALALATACSSGAKSSSGSEAPLAGDAGGAAPRQIDPKAAGVTATPSPPPAAPATPGTVEVAVEWLSPPTDLLVPAGRNKCGAARRPPLLVSSLGGVEGALVRLEGVPAPASGEKKRGAKKAGAAEIAVRECQLEPRAVRAAGPGASLALTSFDERRHEIALESVPEGKGEAAPLARVPLVLVGQRVELELERAGLVRVTSAADPESAAWVVVPEHEHVAVSDERGRVRFEHVPAGRYEVSVWHPPVAARQPALTARAAIEVASGGGASTTVSLAPHPANR
ncbi:MAG TPA: protoporphyrinogen oxidase [Kofleriaceae bacterium]|nr:protoporphyrinogen oxidase [Kofleriaceae bacterium]